MWRWDQGRLIYFQFDVIKKLSSVLVKFDNVDISECEGLFRASLVKETEMPFSPSSYTVLRNYKRVFECAFLATAENKRLMVSDFCRELAKKDGDMDNVDDYLLSFVSRFRFPFPAFDGYQIVDVQVYPFCAIIKYLLALRLAGRKPCISLDEIFRLLIANNCSGREDLDYYMSLQPMRYTHKYIEMRQLREMCVFISQLSFLNMHNRRLWLDIANQSTINELAETFLSPTNIAQKENRTEEFVELTKLTNGMIIPSERIFVADYADIEFIEGKRKRVMHFRIERSPKLRKIFQKTNTRPVCNMCQMDVLIKYPWTTYMLDIHHLLPLSSGVAINSKGTSLKDIVGLCPSCHRSVHIYYSKWLKRKGQDDFSSSSEAKSVYLLAKEEIA